MDISNDQLEKNVSASFGYVKKDMLMLNDAFSDIHDKVQHLSLNQATLLDEVRKLRSDLAQERIAKEAKVYVAKTKKAKKKAVKKVKKVIKAPKEKKKDDLSRVEGIGSKIRTILYNNNILTYTKLAKTSTKKLRKILSKEGPMYEMHNPDTWPKQAKLASKNKWEALERLQKKLIGGVDETSAPIKLSKPAKKALKKIVKKAKKAKKKIVKPVKKVVLEDEDFDEDDNLRPVKQVVTETTFE